MKNRRNNRGFTVAEALVTVGLIAALAAVAFVALMGYLRELTKLEYDGYAKEIFVAAQNHLSAAETENYLERTDFGTLEEEITGLEDTGAGAYAFVVAGDHTPVTSQETVLNLMLPAASVDETVRLGGSYLVRYHRQTAQVLDVFYWSEAGRFAHLYSDDDYAAFLANRRNADALKTYGTDRSVIGYYGGTEAQSLETTEALSAPSITVHNGDRLTVTVTSPNEGILNARLKLVITGLASGATREISLDPAGAGGNIQRDAVNSLYTVILDDITASGLHFAELFCSGAQERLIPGEDVAIQAVAYNNSALSNIAKSARQTTNSLFGDASSVTGGQAEVANIRHLENLDQSVSGVNQLMASVKFHQAVQTTDLDWTEFFEGTARIYHNGGETTKTGCFLPVTPSGTLDYNGQGHTIRKVAVDTNRSAGLFGQLTGGSVQNVKLVDFTIKGENSAGALAGAAVNTAVSNVLALQSEGSTAATIIGKGSAGGLVGQYAGAMQNCAAALVVCSENGAAGGLLGTVSGDESSVTGSYAGGHTVSGKYDPTAWNVTAGGSAGGLIGDAGSAQVRCCYATCSAKGATAGGLAGQAAGTLTGCYATGLTAGTLRGALVGQLTGTVSGCSYYEIINETGQAQGKICLDPVGSGDPRDTAALDATAAAYNTFVGTQRMAAVAYDPVLKLYYQGKYELLTVRQLGATVAVGDYVNVHYGDWPAPELWAVNVR